MPQLTQAPSRSTTATHAADTAVAKPSSHTAVLPPATATLAALIDAAEPAMIAIDRLDPSPWNREIREDDPDLAGLADSIRRSAFCNPSSRGPKATAFSFSPAAAACSRPGSPADTRCPCASRTAWTISRPRRLLVSKTFSARTSPSSTRPRSSRGFCVAPRRPPLPPASGAP